MSRAFVKEADGDAVLEDLPERPVSKHPNYVTPEGLRLLRVKLRELHLLRNSLAGSDDLVDKQSLKSVERDLRYFEERTSTAVVIEPATRSPDRVHFGCSVEVIDQDDHIARFSIVGEDEANVAEGKISWVSPLAHALMDAEIGDVVIWQRPAGDKELNVISIHAGTP